MLCLARNRVGVICIGILVYISAFAQPPAHSIKFNPAGKFKIVQFTDIHFKNGSAKNDSLLTLISNILDREQPAMVLLTGDIVTSKPGESGWQTVVKPIIDRKIPWAAVLGNHDDEHDLKRAGIISLLEKLPNSLVQAGPKELGASGNYIIRIKASKDQGEAARLYCIDSNAYTTLKGVGDYGWIKFEQVQWFRAQSRAENGNPPVPCLVFFHIPVPEYHEVWTSQAAKCIGVKNEAVCSPVLNSGMFAAMRESEGIMGVFVGHDHDNDYAGNLHGICLAYGRLTGFDAYGDLPRGARVIELLEGKQEFNSWIRTGAGEVVNQFTFPTAFEKTSETSPEESKN